ncbi:MAG: DUF4105 domain-containing protein [Cyclobacteriaceae bacterium]
MPKLNLKSLIIPLFICFSIGLKAGINLSDKGEISVLTFGPYQGELYSAFGHSGIRVYDPAANINWIYHYGVFNFKQKNFFWNFARGKMRYSIGLADYTKYVAYYKDDNRSITELVLNLTPEEKQMVFDFLQENYQPENREYNYNYVYDNCATKIKEVIKKAVPGQINFTNDYVEEGVTIRDLMDKYLKYQPWGDWIIDIGLGSQIDKVANTDEYLFLPDYVTEAFKSAQIKRGETSPPLVKKTNYIYQSKPETFENGVFTPFNTFVLLFFVVGFFTNRDFKTMKRSKWIDVVLFTFVGIFGWWCTFLWLGTDHLSKMNYNLLWAIPIFIPIVFFLETKKYRKVFATFFKIIGIWYIILLVIWGALPQPLHSAMIPLVITMVLRSFYINFDLNKKIRTEARLNSKAP